MRMYKCLKCGKSIELKQVRDKIRCPYCGYRILVKERPKTVIRVSAD
jgi:DNA-directed RNA polymerase subunit P